MVKEIPSMMYCMDYSTKNLLDIVLSSEHRIKDPHLDFALKPTKVECYMDIWHDV